MTVTWRPETAESVTAKFALVVPVLPSVTVTSLIDSAGVASSSVIVTSPAPSPIEALVALDSVTLTVSSSSSSASPSVVTAIGCVSTPGIKVRIPLAAL